MKASLIFFCIFSLGLSASWGYAQSTIWQNASQWTMYSLRGAKFYKISVDSLDRYRNKSLNDDTMRMFLSKSVELPANKAPMWMGAYVVSCAIDHKRRKVDISSYGGFLFDEKDKKFYSIPEDIQKDWLNYLADCAGSLSIP
jgi:hypothetical protein